MIDKAELNKELKIPSTDTSQDSLIQSIIWRAKEFFDSECNRDFWGLSRTEFYNGNGTDLLLVDQYPFSKDVDGLESNADISVLKYWDSGEEEYTDLITETGDTISNSTEVLPCGELILLKGYTFHVGDKPKNIKITYEGGYRYKAGTGTLAVTAGATAVVGTSTLFTTECSVGDYLVIGSERIKIKTITDATHIVLEYGLITAASTASYKISNLPLDLVNGIIQKGMELYYDSPQGQSRFGISSSGVGSQASDSTSYNKVDFQPLINKYKRLNV